MVLFARFFFCHCCKRNKTCLTASAGRNLVKNAFTHFFMLFAVVQRLNEGDFQQAEKQHKKVATANFDITQNSK